MKLQQLKINNYGKLKDTEIEFGDKINLIYGKNEAGKSTMLSYIINSLYGISKNKKGRDHSDFEKYEPWAGEEFSGKLVYQLDNGETYEIYRDFKKKNPKIFNENKEDISKQFPIDKSTGNAFFYEQTQIDEQLFLSTLVSYQKETRLQKSEQGILVQKIANLVGTGEDKVSYKIAMDRLNRRQLDEVGTNRTREKPINLINQKIQKIEQEKEQLETYQKKQYEAEANETEKIKEIENLEKEMQILQEWKFIYEEQEKENQKIEIKENLKKQNIEKIKEIDNRIDSIHQENKENKTKQENNKMQGIIITIIILCNIILQFIPSINIIIKTTILVISIIFLAIIARNIISKKKRNEEKKNKYELIKEKVELLENEAKILEENNQEIEQEIQEIKKQNEKKLQEQQERTMNKYPDISNKNVFTKIQNIQNKINNGKIQLHTLQLDKKTIQPNLEKLAQMEEEYTDLQDQKQELQKLNTAIDTAKQILEECYETMKHTVAPKFTQNLSNIISEITNKKYTNVQFHDEIGLIVENENGEYIPATKLSIGTIEQLYLSLRLSMIDDLSEEKLPIILDETFAYFDDERLKNFLEYISKKYNDKQILILTCTKREKEIMDKQKILYKWIEL